MFFAPNIDTTHKEFVLPEEESIHCIKVLRKQVGDVIQILDGRGHVYDGEILVNHPKKCQISITSPRFFKPSPSIHLALAPTKNADRIEWLVEKGTELGCTHFSFLITHRTERTKLNMDRLLKIAIAAMKQSQRYYLPQLDAPLALNAFLNNYKGGWVAHCEGSFKRTEINSQKNARILIGPEGDFTSEEIQAIYKQGYQGLTLGDARLRTETAALKAIILMEGLKAHV